MSRWAWAEVRTSAIEANVRLVAMMCAPAEVWAVVKADGYGHGAVPAARAALAGGAGGLCVALLQEGVELREAGIAAPILVLSEQPAEHLYVAVHHQLQLTIYSEAQLEALAQAGGHRHPVHMKIDTGMHRVGVAPEHAVALANSIVASPAAELIGVFTHLAVADDLGARFTGRQLDRFESALAALRAAGHEPPLVHAANSAGALGHPRARYDMVRVGIAIYGVSPAPALAHLCGFLQRALSLHAFVSHVQRVKAGEGLSYGLHHEFDRDSTVATLPIGYADGVPRRLHSVGGAVLIGGVRRSIVGAVTMDQLMVDCGDDQIAVGDHAVLIGRQGDELITAAEWADRLGTISYEILCGISPRIERRYLDGPGEHGESGRTVPSL